MHFTKNILTSLRIILCSTILAIWSPNLIAKPVHDVSIEISSEANFKLTIDPQNTKVQLNLTTPSANLNFDLVENKNLLSSDIVLDGVTEFTVYKGKLTGVSKSWARFTYHNGKLSGAYFNGKDMFFVSRSDQIDARLNRVQTMLTQGAELLVYNVNDIKHSGTCALEDTHTSQSFNYTTYIEQLNTMVSSAASKELKVSLVADLEFEQGSAEQAAVEMLAEMNVVDGIFAEQVGVTITVDQIRVLTNTSVLNVTDAVDLIIAYRDYVAVQYENPGASHLFTGKNLDGSTIGIAYVGALCNDFAVGVTQRFGMNTALVTAHEFGHNFGAPHDNQSGSICASTAGTFLMNPGINGSDTFSGCSLVQMQQLINQSICLVDVASAPVITSTPNAEANVGVDYRYDENNTLEVDGTGDLVFYLDFGPDGMQVSADGIVSWQPNSIQVGVNPVQITVTSPYGTDSQSFEINVIAQPIGDFIDFNAQPLTSFGRGQDGQGSVTVSPDGASVTLQGNRWMKIDFDYEITPDTIIEFDYVSNAQGEIHGIGLHTITKANSSRTFNLWGTQSWGLQSSRYTQIGQVQRITIPVGDFYTGAMNYLFFVMDHDVSNPNSNGTYSNVTVFESGQDPDPDPDPEPEPEPNDVIDFTQYTISKYGSNQNPNGDGNVEILDAGNSLRLEGNLWRKIEINQTLTASSVLEFEFKSHTEGEIHGLGFGNSNSVNAGKTFKIFGTQNWGIRDFSYTGNGEYQRIIIPIGEYYQGDFQYLFFSMDNDVSNPGSESIFKNVAIK